MSQIFRDHSHIGDELARLRKAIAGNKSAALLAADKLSGEVTEHKEREEALFVKLSSQRMAR